jgi:uncharacterized protein YutE (UPF0331/DUF86 family)
VRFRDKLVRRYDALSFDEVEEQVERLTVLSTFDQWIRDYLRRELGI